MTPDEFVYATLCESGLKGTKVGWPVGGAPPLPWFTYKRRKGGEMFADDHNWGRMIRYEVDLYQSELDDTERDAFEEYVALIGPFSSYETWIPGENCWSTTYSLTYHKPLD